MSNRSDQIDRGEWRGVREATMAPSRSSKVPRAEANTIMANDTAERHGTGHSPGHGHGGEAPALDVSEHGAARDGQPQVLDRRLFMQLLVFDTPPQSSSKQLIAAIGEKFVEHKVGSVIYEAVSDPRAIGVLTFSEDPAVFVTAVRPVLADPAFGLTLQPSFSMLGRTYSTGFEQDLAFWLLERPAQTAVDESCNWAVWYPLRRSGAFARLEPKEQGAILREHGTIGRTYGSANLAHDIRLACHGLDANDNEFVIGLIGSELYPLSHVVQSMRKTRQTAEFISQMGPFFVGRVAFRHRPR